MGERGRGGGLGPGGPLRPLALSEPPAWETEVGDRQGLPSLLESSHPLPHTTRPLPFHGPAWAGSARLAPPGTQDRTRGRGRRAPWKQRTPSPREGPPAPTWPGD